MDSNQALDDYAARGHRRVAGWLDPTAIEVTRRIARRQVGLGVSGGVAEIGVHHGRFFILLHLLRQPGERSAAYDLFEMQGDNVDQSGRGNKSIFLANLQRHGGIDVEAIARSRNSLEMTPAEVLADIGPVRLFSVDGGHTADITASDLALAEATLCPGGVVILDDYFNPSWPGVSEGANRHFAGGASALLPVCIASNKFVFTNRPQHAADYRQALGDVPGTVAESQQVFGARVLILSPRRRSLVASVSGSRLWQRLEPTMLGQLVKAVARRVLLH